MNRHRSIRVALCWGLAMVLVASRAWGGTSDGMVIGATKIVDHGADSQRYNVVLIAEGYQQSELNKFAQDAQHFADVFLQTPPFDTNCSIFNIWRIDVTSTDSGADDPATCGDGSTGSGAMPATYFDATFCGGGSVRRLLTANTSTAMTVLNAQVPNWDTAVIVVNTTEYGGAGGGSVGVTSTTGSGWPEIAIHEFGHSAFGLADEYEYYQGCGVDPPGTRDHHPNVEPVAANVTVETDPTKIKWRDLFFPSITIPTTTNADCTMCDPQADPFPGEQRVGLYEGADYFHCDAFRPVFNCKFRVLAADFCPVCRRRMLQVLQPFQPANSPPVCNAGGPYSAECAGATTSVALDGSMSSDADCNALTFSWTGPFMGGTASGPMPTVDFSGTGTFTVNLGVSDGQATTTCSTTAQVQDTQPPTVSCPADLVTPTDPGRCDAVATFTTTATDVCDANPSVVCNPPSGSTFQEGVTPVHCTATDASSQSASCSFDVTVVDKERPVISNAAVTPNTLWPPNHKMALVTVNYTATDNCGAVSCGLSASSNEPDNGLGDGDTAQDIQLIPGDAHHLSLRAERSGKGQGRIYAVTIACTDTTGNTTSSVVQVTVPHDQRK